MIIQLISCLIYPFEDSEEQKIRILLIELCKLYQTLFNHFPETFLQVQPNILYRMKAIHISLKLNADIMIKKALSMIENLFQNIDKKLSM
jgi:hypothetical protein